ncbi:MAG: cytochrome C [Sterolibacterium sp.]|nr:cytochrome C [Sterolibacterium sp.]
MRTAIVAGLLVAGLALAGPASASADLAKSSGCMKCHDVEKKKMGPSFKDVAAAHKGKTDEAAVVAKLTGGKDHPAVKASEADVKAVVKWILTL